LFSAVARDRLQPGDEALAGAIGVGHLLECGGQLTGGNYEPIAGAGLPPPLSAEHYARLGYPLARVMADGSAEIGLPPGAPGIVDPDYTGEMKVIIYNGGHESAYIRHGQRIAQIILLPYIGASLEPATEIPVTERGASGFGSTDKKDS
jgi:hypothetical protein